MLTPKQEEILNFVKRFGEKGKLTALEIGVGLGQPRKKAEKWAKPALKELIKQKIVERDNDAYKITIH